MGQRREPAQDVPASHAHNQTQPSDDDPFGPRPELPAPTPNPLVNGHTANSQGDTSSRPVAPPQHPLVASTFGSIGRATQGHPYLRPISPEEFNRFVELNGLPNEDCRELARFAQMPYPHRELYIAWNIQTMKRHFQQFLEHRAEPFIVDKDLDKNLKAAAYEKLADPTLQVYSTIPPKTIRKAVVRSLGGNGSQYKTPAAKSKMESTIKYHLTQGKANMKRHITGRRVSHGADMPLEEYAGHIFKGRSTSQHLARAAIFV